MYYSCECFVLETFIFLISGYYYKRLKPPHRDTFSNTKNHIYKTLFVLNTYVFHYINNSPIVVVPSHQLQFSANSNCAALYLLIRLLAHALSRHFFVLVSRNVSKNTQRQRHVISSVFKTHINYSL
jgi:hypothetical protein